MADAQANLKQMSTDVLCTELGNLRAGKWKALAEYDYEAAVSKLEDGMCSTLGLMLSGEAPDPDEETVKPQEWLGSLIEQWLQSHRDTESEAKEADEKLSEAKAAEKKAKREKAKARAKARKRRVKPSKREDSDDSAVELSSDDMDSDSEGTSSERTRSPPLPGKSPLSASSQDELAGLVARALELPVKAEASRSRPALQSQWEESESSGDEGEEDGAAEELVGPLSFRPGQRNAATTVMLYTEPPKMSAASFNARGFAARPVGQLLKSVTAVLDAEAGATAADVARQLVSELRQCGEVTITKDGPAWKALVFTGFGARVSKATGSHKYPLFVPTADAMMAVHADPVAVCTHRQMNWDTVMAMAMNAMGFLASGQQPAKRPREAALELVALVAAAGISMVQAGDQRMAAGEYCWRRYLFLGRIGVQRASRREYEDMWQRGSTLVLQALAQARMAERASHQAGKKRIRVEAEQPEKNMKPKTTPTRKSKKKAKAKFLQAAWANQ